MKSAAASNGLPSEFSNATFKSKQKLLNIMNRPPPYFPQNQLSPPDENRYRKFKFLVGTAIFFLTLLLIGAGVGVYYLVRWMIS
jgi:hypothetical protein